MGASPSPLYRQKAGLERGNDLPGVPQTHMGPELCLFHSPGDPPSRGLVQTGSPPSLRTPVFPCIAAKNKIQTQRRPSSLITQKHFLLVLNDWD